MEGNGPSRGTSRRNSYLQEGGRDGGCDSSSQVRSATFRFAKPARANRECEVSRNGSGSEKWTGGKYTTFRNYFMNGTTQIGGGTITTASFFYLVDGIT